MPARTVITIGNFDGVHMGHAALIARARDIAGPSGRVIAMVFDPHPLATLRPGDVPARLSTWDQRRRCLLALGASDVVRLAPDPATLSQTPEQFVERLVRDYAPVAVVEGPDFRFGKGRSGDIRSLVDLGRLHDFQVEIVPPVHSAGEPVSSSAVRSAVAGGNVEAAARLLGRSYELEGTVVRGDRRGRTIGFPTANLATDCLLPADGVYAGRAILPDGRAAPAAVSVGTKPTFGTSPRVAEAYIIGMQAGPEGCLPGLPEYDWPLRLEFVAGVRPQARFASTRELVDQMARDCARVAELLSPRIITREKAIPAR